MMKTPKPSRSRSLIIENLLSNFIFSASLYFGIITCVAGILGVVIGTETAKW